MAQVTDSDPGGWRIAALVVLLAVSLTASAYYVHTRIYCDPAHPSCVRGTEHNESASHEADDHDAAQTHGGGH